ncbi:recombinase family protein [Krasilnikovia sp. M28-CT-15]|uniref:recombinase family protein n=1 Tax=Krasilnikovia sp. M28-CT-15 TaxID=3373540 RepID=UPI00387773D8
MRASLNVRLSKAAGSTNMSRDGMIADLRALCAREGFEEIALHVDDGYTGSLRDRPGFQAWLADAREGRADVLIAWHVDRMTREGLNVAAALLDVVEGKDPATGKIVSPPVRLMDTKGLDSADGEAFRMLFVIRAEIARAERERMRDRTRSAVDRLRRAGRWPGGAPPYGYRVVPAANGVGKTLAVEPTEAAVVQEAAHMILAGHSLGRVTRWLNERGHKPRFSNTWRRVSLTQMLTGDALTGAVSIGGKVLRDDTGKRFTPFPEVLDLPTVLALRKALAPKAAAGPRGRAPARLLSGIITCGSCGARLYVATPGRDRGIVYRCNARGQGQLCSRSVHIDAPRVEEFVAGEFLASFAHVPMTVERVTVTGDGDLAEIDDRISAALADMAMAATPEAFAQLQELQAERARIEAAPRRTVVERVPTGLTLGQEWDRRGTEGRRELLTDAVGVLAANPGRPTGRQGFDSSRVLLRWAEGDPDLE